MRVTCPGAVVSTGSEGEPLCLDGLGAPVAWESQASFTFADSAEPFFAGFALVMVFWALGKAVSLVLRVVR